MITATLGSTGLVVGRLGLGCARPSRLGLDTGGTVADAVRVIHGAIDLGVNVIDTAPAYGTEDVVGEALAGVRRDGVILCTKTLRGLAVRAGWEGLVQRTLSNLDKSLRALRTDSIDVFYLHHISPGVYRRAFSILWEPLCRQRDAGKIRFLGISETWPKDQDHRTLFQANLDPWDVIMHGPERGLYAPQHGAGAVVMAPRSVGYAKALYETEADVVLCGTGNLEHLAENIMEIENDPVNCHTA